MAVLTEAEVNEQAELGYVRGTYYVALTDSSTPYTSSLNYTTVQADEVTAGDGGYARLSFTYTTADLIAYSNGQPIEEKLAIFVHDGSSADIVFNHVVLLREVSGTYSVVGYQQIEDGVVLSSGESAQIKVNVLLSSG